MHQQMMPNEIKDSPIFQSIFEGAHRHLNADKRFHGSPFFQYYAEKCTDLVKQISFFEEVNRRWFIGHILFEMLLDRLLVQHFPTVAPFFYQELRKIKNEDFIQFIKAFGAKEPERVWTGFEHFRQAGYIANYPDNNLFAYSLSRVLMRVGLPPLSFADRCLLIEGVETLERTVFANRQQVFF